MTAEKHPRVYFHVGLGKVASTYLQYRFFPKLQGLQYIQRTQYRKSPEIIRKGNADQYLVSREFDRQLPEEVEWFTSHFPDAHPIILLRHHDQWIASQYRRYVKNGGHLLLKEFLDLHSNQGPWKIEEAQFFPYIQTLEKHFKKAPLVLFYEDLKKDPQAFFDALASFMNATYEWNELDLSPFHASYSEKQLKFMRKWGSRFFNKNRKLPNHPIPRWLKRRSEMLGSYLLLYAALLVPDQWVEQETLYPEAYMQQIRDYFQEDWEACVSYAKNHQFNL